MAKKTTSKGKKVVVSSKKKRSASGISREPSGDTLIFNRTHFILMGVGIGLIALGLLLMSGGGSEDYNVFDPDRIYSFRRTVLAPFLILAGLGVEIYMIFKK
jgi:hypothetical protein